MLNIEVLLPLLCTPRYLCGAILKKKGGKERRKKKKKKGGKGERKGKSFPQVLRLLRCSLAPHEIPVAWPPSLTPT